MKDLYTAYGRYLRTSLDRLAVRLEKVYETSIKPLIEQAERDEQGGISRKSFRLFSGQTASLADSLSTEIFNEATELSATVIRHVVDTLDLDDEDKQTVVEGILSGLFSQDLLSVPFPAWQQRVSALIAETLQYTSFPGRRVKLSLDSLRRAVTDPAYPNSVRTIANVFVGAVSMQALRDAILTALFLSGRTKIRLVRTHESPLCEALEGEYDIRFAPPLPLAECTCRFETVKEPERYPEVVIVNQEPIVVPTLEQIEAKEEQLRRVRRVEDGEYFATILQAEIEFMREVYNYFSLDETRAGKQYGRTRTGRNTVAFSDEIEVLAQRIYGGTLTQVKSPVDIITPVFGIETKATTAKEKAEFERGRMSAEDIARKYAYLEEMRRRGYTQGNHKYVLGVFDLENDRVVIYEQNYFSNKNSATMLPVAIVENYSQTEWIYERTPYREFKVVGINNINLVELRSRNELNDPFYWEVVRAHKQNVKHGDRVEYFDGSTLRKGRVYNDSSEPDEKYFSTGVTILWDDGEVERVEDYNVFNEKYRLIKPGVFETLEQRGISPVPSSVESGMTLEDKRKLIQRAEAVLNQKSARTA